MKTLSEIRAKEKTLLKYLHNEIHTLSPENDPFDDKSLMRKEITRYLFLNWNKATEDKHVQGRWNLRVNTNIFGWKHKHVDKYEWNKLALNQ